MTQIQMKIFLMIAFLACFTHCTKTQSNPPAPGPIASEEKAAQSCDVEALRKMSTNSAFVSYAYCVVLGRAADSSGRDHWVTVLATRPDRLEVFLAFVSTVEFGNQGFKNKSAHSMETPDYIRYLYTRLLGREPTKEEVSQLVAVQARRNLTREQLAQEVVLMPETRSRHGL